MQRVRRFPLATQRVRPFPLAMQHFFYSFVSKVCHCWCLPFSAGHAAFLFICLPGLSLLVSALFRWPCSISIHLSPRSVTACPPFSAGHAAFLFICLPGLSLLVSALFRWPCSMSIHLSPRFVTAGVRPFPLAMQHFYSFVSQVCHCWCPPFPAGHAAFLFICLPGLSLLVSALFRWPCSMSIHLSPRFVTAGVRPFPLAMQHFYSFVSQVCHCWCPPFSAGHAAFLFICLPGLSLLVTALFRWQCSISIHLSPRSVTAGVICLPGLSLLVSALFCWPCSISILLSPRSVTAGVCPCPLAMHHFYSLVSRSVTAGVRPLPLAMQHFYSFVSQSVTAGVRPFPLAMQHFYSCVSQVCHCWCPLFSAGHAAFLFICLPGLSLLVSALFRWPCSISIHLSPRSVTACPPFSAGHAAFLFICLPGLSLLVSALFRWPRSISIHLSPRFVTASVRPFPLAMQHFYSFVSQVCHCWCPPFSAGHAAFLFICLPGLSLLVSALFRWQCSISIHLSPRSVTACPPFSAGHAAFLFSCLPGLSLLVSALFRWPCSISLRLSSR